MYLNISLANKINWNFSDANIYYLAAEHENCFGFVERKNVQQE